jgi:hypothetical protein
MFHFIPRIDLIDLTGAAALATAATGGRRSSKGDDDQPKYKLANMSTQPVSSRARSHSLAWAVAAANARKRSKSMGGPVPGLEFAIPRSDGDKLPQPSPGGCSINRYVAVSYIHTYMNTYIHTYIHTYICCLSGLLCGSCEEMSSTFANGVNRALRCGSIARV